MIEAVSLNIGTTFFSFHDGSKYCDKKKKQDWVSQSSCPEQLDRAKLE